MADNQNNLLGPGGFPEDNREFRLPPHPLMVKKPWCWLDAPQLDRLDHACMIVVRAFDVQPYLVGSVLEHSGYRDVDVRVILPDAEYAAMFDVCGGDRRTNAYWSLLCASVSEYLHRLTDLPIDFQIQSRTHANDVYGDRKRVPLAMYPYASEPAGDDRNLPEGSER